MSMKNKQVQIESMLALLDANEVMQYISPEKLAQIKKYDATPMFIMMTVGHVGESTGALYAKVAGAMPPAWYKQLWPLRAVKQLVLSLQQAPVPIYTDVHSINGVAGRPIVGYIMASAKKIINDSTHAIGIAYISDVSTRKKLECNIYDVCSLEAKCIFNKAENAANWVVEQVKEIMGIVLFSSTITKPGFKDASIHAVVTAMKKTSDDDDDDDIQKLKGTKMPVTLQEIKQYIEINKVSPLDLFSVSAVTKEAKVVDVFKNEQQIATQLKDAKIIELEQALKPYKASVVQNSIITRIKESVLLKDAPKQQVAYLEKIIKVSADNVDAITQELIDTEIKTQLDVMKSIGVEFKKDVIDTKDPAQKIGSETATVQDYTKAEFNPLIPKSA